MGEPSPRRFAGRIIWLLIIVVTLFVLIIVGKEVLWFWLNIVEFGELFILPIYFTLISGFILATIAFFRVDFKNRRSIVWWILRLILRAIKEQGVMENIPPDYFDFGRFKLPLIKFILWQITKICIGALFMGNLLFGMAIYSMSKGWDPQLNLIWNLFKLPFITPPFDMNYAKENVIPLIPSLTLILPPIIGALTLRFFLLVVVTNLVRIFAFSPVESIIGRAPFYLALIEGLLSIGLLWAMVNAFFTDYIDYNTRVVIGGLAAIGIILAIFAIKDARRRIWDMPVRRMVIMRLVPILLIILLVGSTITIQNSIADANKVAWRGPYTMQEIAVNRYLAQLDEVKEVPYNFSIKVVPIAEIDSYVKSNSELLKKVRLWDWEAAFAKLKPEIGLIPYIDFQDSDILRFNGTLYWSASMKPILPITVKAEDRWYAERLVYSHVPNGFLILNANEGKIEDTSAFFRQRRVYYGEGGLFNRVWFAYPTDRERSDELEGYFYRGRGGVDIPPPLSWIFEFIFLTAFPNKVIHVLRYRDVYERMQTLFPYFQYTFYGKRVDMLPVTDGENTYWLMPLIIVLDTKDVPWSNGNSLMRLVGYSLIDVYHGDIRLIILGDDFFSQLFKRVYSKYITTEIPDWLKNQLRYPEELFEWRVNMYNFYHVTSPETFIIAKEFFEIPRGLDTYYVIAKPPNFEKPEYIGLLSLELRGAGGRNLAGYMVVRNEYEGFGEMIFYAVDIKSPIKLLGPTAVLEALEKNPEFAKLKTLLRAPRIGDIILYRIGDHDVYLIPVYTAGAGGVVTEMGVVAAVGATFTGKYYVGLSTTGSAEEAFRSFLITLSGEETPKVHVITIEQRKANIMNLFKEANVKLLQPISMNPNVSFREGIVTYISDADWNATKSLIKSFIENWVSKADQALLWFEDSKMNIGVL
ncbi:MAG: UPF0182 family protein, partial [Nitrososphaerales archaeon]|nr:UPF0182 family protein [Nitrososphaerales archaeon]